MTLALINRAGPTTLTVTLDGPAPADFEVYVTDRERHFEHTGRVELTGNTATLTIPARSVTTLSAGPPPDEDE